MPVITGGILRSPAGAPAWSSQGGNQGWLDFWKNQFGNAPRYPVTPAGVVPTGNRFPNYRAGLPMGTPRTGATDVLAGTGGHLIRAARPAGTGTYINPYAPGQFMFPPGMVPSGAQKVTFQRHGGTTVPPGGVTGTSSLPPPTPVEGPPAVLGPVPWQNYLGAFMRGYMNP